MGYQTLQVFIDIVEWVDWLWAEHWVQLLNAFGVLLAVSIFFLLNEAWGKYSDECERLDFEKHERIKREAIKRAKEIIEEERRELGSKKGRRIFKVPRNPGDNSRKKFRDGLRRRGLLPPDTSDSEPGSDSNTSNLSPDDPIFDGARDSDDTHDWNPELKKQLKHFRDTLLRRQERRQESRRRRAEEEEANASDMTDESEIRRYGNPEPSAPPLEEMPSPDHILAAQLADRLANLKGLGSEEDIVREHSPDEDAKLSAPQEHKTSSGSYSSGSKLAWKLANWDVNRSEENIVSNNSSASDVKPSAPLDDKTPPEHFIAEAQVAARLANLKGSGSKEDVVSKHSLHREVEPSAPPREETPPSPYHSPSPLEEKPANLKGHRSEPEVVREHFSGRDVAPSAPPRHETPPRPYHSPSPLEEKPAILKGQGSATDSGTVEAAGGYDSVSTSGFDWYNEQGWRGKKRPPTPPLRPASEDSSEDEEDAHLADIIANWEARRPEEEDNNAEEALDDSNDDDFDEFILEKLRQRDDIARDKIPTKETLVELGLKNVFAVMLEGLRKSEVGDLSEHTLELIALYKVNRIIQLKKDESDDEEEQFVVLHEMDESEETESDVEESSESVEEPSSESAEEGGRIQQGIRHLAGLGSDFVWNRVLPGPWS